jgi:hypothetical protein
MKTVLSKRQSGTHDESMVQRHLQTNGEMNSSPPGAEIVSAYM